MIPKRKDVVMEKTFRFTNHALDRMEARNVSETKVAQILASGQIFAGKHGLHRAKIWEHTKNTVDKYVVVFSKSDHLVITVERTASPIGKGECGNLSFTQERKSYRQRKRVLQEREFDAWCREEYNSFNLRFTA